jgi:Zn-dependent protease with chaperone function
MNRLSFIFVLILNAGLLWGQNLDNYTNLSCQGEIPGEYLSSSTQKFERDIQKALPGETDRQERKNRERFSLQTNFALDDLLLSGFVLFNDPVSNYLNEVMDVLCGNDESLKKKVTVYTLRSPGVNAFATDRGNIFVTLGLLSQLENEAQLAFILAHELAHYQNDHAFNLFQQTSRLEKDMSTKKALKSTTFDEVMIEKNHYSKELETEADEEGLKTFLNSPYSFATLNTVFDVLKYAYLPFDEVPFEKAYFEQEYFRFPDDFALETVQMITGSDETEDDSKSTHPNIGSRRKALHSALQDQSDEGRKIFVVSEERFLKLRQVARFEIPQLYLQEERLSDALYTAHLLLKEYPDNFYLKKIVGKALYIHTKYSNDDDYSYSGDYEEVEGESQQAHYFMNQLRETESTVLALKYNWQLHRENPEDEEIQLLVNDLFIELARHAKSLDEFENKPPVLKDAEETEAPAEEEKDKPVSKYDKIKSQKEEAKRPGEAEYWRYAFLGFLDDTAFQQAFETGQQEYKSRKKKIDYYESREGRIEWRRRQAKVQKKGYRLGIPKIIVVNPFYLRTNNKKEEALRLVDSEVGQEKLREYMEVAAEKSGLNLSFLDVTDLRPTETDKFNEIRELNEWFAQQMQFDELSITPGYQQEKINAIAEKYNTDYALWSGVLSSQDRKVMLIYAVLYDLRTGRRDIIKFDYIKKREFPFLIKGHIYDAFLQIKAKE